MIQYDSIFMYDMYLQNNGSMSNKIYNIFMHYIHIIIKVDSNIK